MMGESEYNSQIETIASLITADNLPIDEQDLKKLQKYREYAIKNFNLSDNVALQIVYDALLYLKLKESSDFDPLQEGDKFGGGFS